MQVSPGPSLLTYTKYAFTGIKSGFNMHTLCTAISLIELLGFLKFWSMLAYFHSLTNFQVLKSIPFELPDECGKVLDYPYLAILFLT